MSSSLQLFDTLVSLCEVASFVQLMRCPLENAVDTLPYRGNRGVVCCRVFREMEPERNNECFRQDVVLHGVRRDEQLRYRLKDLYFFETGFHQTPEAVDNI